MALDTCALLSERAWATCERYCCRYSTLVEGATIPPFYPFAGLRCCLVNATSDGDAVREAPALRSPWLHRLARAWPF